MPRFRLGGGVGRIQAERRAEAGFGFVVLAQRIVSERGIHVRRQGFGLQTRGGFELRHGFRHLAARHVEIAEVVVRRHVVGTRPHRVHQLRHARPAPATRCLRQPVLGHGGQRGGGAHADQAVIIASRFEQGG